MAALDTRPLDSTGTGALTLLAGTHGGDILEITCQNEGGSNSSNSKTNSSSNSSKLNDDSSSSSSSSSLSTLAQGMDLSKAAAETLIQSHFRGELWGLAAHPLNRDLAATVGDDGLLCVWSIRRNTLLCQQKLGWKARSVTWHPLGNILAVGFHERTKGGLSTKKPMNNGKKGKKGGGGGGGGGGGDKEKEKSKSKKEKNGTSNNGDEDDEDEGGDEGEKSKNVPWAPPNHAVSLFLFSDSSNLEPKLSFLASCCESEAWIADLKFSPNGEILGVASHDKHLYFYDVPVISSADPSG